MFFNSIRWRLQLYYGLILLLILAGFGVTAYQFERGRRLHKADEDIQHRLMSLMAELQRNLPGNGPPHGSRPGPGGGFPPPMDAEEDEPFVLPGGGHGSQSGDHSSQQIFKLKPSTMALFAGTNTGSCYYVVWHRNGTVFGKSINAPATTPKPDTSHSFSGMRSNGEFREAFEATPPGECLLVGRTLEPELAELHQFAWTLSGIGGVILVLGLAGGWWLATGAIRPIAEISSAAANISAGDLSRRIDIADTDTEFGHLTAVLNSTFARLEAAFLQQGRFTADAAHELRTPVSVILLQVQTALKSERTPAEYRNALEACQRSANRMKTLMESLLELARLDAGQEPLRKKSFDITETVGECIDLLEPIAAQKGIKIHRTLEPATLQGDPVRLAQVFTNILNNAIHYNRENGTIQIGLKKQGGKVIVTVEDTGVGIAEEEIPKVFERFYRADKARSNINGHTGLGLSICKSIVSAHGGEIEVTSRLGVGTEFIVKLPDTGG